MKKKNYKWLIVIFAHEFVAPDANAIAADLISEFSSSGVSDSNMVLLVKDRLITCAEDDIKLKIYIEKLQFDRATNNYFFEKIREVDFKFESEQSWANIFSWINSNIFSDQTILITISHGSGFGIFGDENMYTKSTTEDLVIHPGNNCDKPFEILWASELASALQSGFKERKIDILMMVNCYMQTFETGWFLRNQVNYLVAAETTFKLYGYAFKELMDKINKNNNVTAKQLTKIILPQFVQKWQNKIISKTALNKISVSVNSLKKYDTLKKKFDEISDILLTLSEKELDTLIKLKNEEIVQVTVDPSPIHRECTPQSIDYLDLVNFFQFIQRTFPNISKLKKLAAQFCKIVKSSVVDIHVGTYFLEKDASGQKKFGINGLSIFLPFNAVSALDTYNNNFAYFGTKTISLLDCDRIADGNSKNVPFAKFIESTSWDEFIKRCLMQMSANDSR